MNAARTAFKDMQGVILKKRQSLNNSFDNYVVGLSHVYTKESRRLNRDIGLSYLNNGGDRRKVVHFK